MRQLQIADEHVATAGFDRPRSLGRGSARADRRAVTRQDVREQRARVVVVLDEKNGYRSQRIRRNGRVRRHLRLVLDGQQRQTDGESRALIAAATSNRDLASMLFDEMPADRQPETEALA